MDDDQRLVGVVPTRRLLTSPLNKHISEVMIRRVVKLSPSETVMAAHELMMQHKLLALPLVDEQNRIMGVIDITMFSDIHFELDTRHQVDEVFESIGFRIAQIKSTLVRNAISGWADELISRRDEITHYVAPVLVSAHRKVSGDQPLDSTMLAGVASVPSRRSVPVWNCMLPTVGGSQQANGSISSGGRTAEKHAIWDSSGMLIIERTGPLPASPSVVPCGELVEDLYTDFENHLADILVELRNRWDN